MNDRTPGVKIVTPAGHRSGFVAIVGRPNVGKSTLLNRILGQKVAIVTPKPQTTRSRILGIKTVDTAQIVFVDTPGMHRPRSLINRRMVQIAEHAAGEADLILWVVDATDGVTPADRGIASQLSGTKRPLCVVLNKIDRVQRSRLLPILADIERVLPDRHVVPVSATSGDNLAELVAQVVRMLPEGPPYYDSETLTDQTERVLAQEVIREQVLLQTRDEVPYSVAVTIDRFEDRNELSVISATMHVERASQKGILIGVRGARIKAIGTAARHELEEVLARRVHLELFVRVQEEWTSREDLLREFGL